MTCVLLAILRYITILHPSARMASVIEQPASPLDSPRDGCVHVSVALQEAVGALPSFPAERGGCVPIVSFIERYADFLSRESDFREAATSRDAEGRDAALQRLRGRSIPEPIIQRRLTQERRIYAARMRGTIVLN